MSFLDFARAHGLIIDQVHATERIQRCGTALHPRSKNGAFWYDGQRGWVYLHDGDAKTIWWNDRSAVPWTEMEKRQWYERKRHAAQLRDDAYERAATRAQSLLRRCKPSSHTYLRNKSLPEVLGLVNDDLELFIPMRNVVNNRLVGGQVISFDTSTRTWSKKMLYGMRAKGAVFRLGKLRATETWLVEGYATGLTLELAFRLLRLNAAVLICFSAANLAYVASMVPGRKFAFADNDKSGTGEGAAKAARVPYCMSSIVGEDANDLYMREGLLAVCQKIIQLRKTTHA